MKKETLELALMLVIGVVIGILGAKLWIGGAGIEISEDKDVNPSLLEEAEVTEETESAVGSNADNDKLTKVADLPGVGVAPKNSRMGLRVDDQAAGNAVVVSGFTFVQPGWVAIYDNRDGKPGWILGAKRFLAGDTSGEVPLLRATIAGESYYAMFHNDDGNLEFDKSRDTLPAVDDVVIVSFDAK